MIKIFQEYFLDDSVFRLVAILKSINKIFEKQLQRNPFLRWVVSNLSTKTCKEIYVLESCSVSMNKIFEVHTCDGILFFFFSIHHTLRYICKCS